MTPCGARGETPIPADGQSKHAEDLVEDILVVLFPTRHHARDWLWLSESCWIRLDCNLNQVNGGGNIFLRRKLVPPYYVVGVYDA